MNQPRKPKKVKAPEGCMPYLTEGKEYEVINVYHNREIFGYGFEISIVEDELDFCNLHKCGHLNGQDWIVTEYEDENNI